jgi:hypothetical protein
MHFPSVEAFVPGHLMRIRDSVVRGQVAALDAAARGALLSEIREALRAYRDDGGFAVPMEAHVAVAQA